MNENMQTLKSLLAITEDAEYAKKLVRGEKAGPGLLNKIDQWFGRMIIDKDKNRFLPSALAINQLERAGFSENQIMMIRSVATDACYTAVETIQKKHGVKAVPDEYKSKLPSSFGVFDLFLNVSESIHVEFAALMRKLFDAKIDKIKDKLVIDKNTIKEGFAMDDIAVGGTVIYKTLKGFYKMSKVKDKPRGNTLRLVSGDTVENAAVVSTDASDWSKFKDKKVNEGRGDFGRPLNHRGLDDELAHEDEYERKKRSYNSKPVNSSTVKEPHGIQINGKMWMRDGKPVSFQSREAAEKAILNSKAMLGKNAVAKPIKEEIAIEESEELVGLGKSLKNNKAAQPAKPVDNVKVEPVDAKVEAPKETVSQFAVDQSVKPSIGPHKGVVHKVIHVFPNGDVNIKPVDLEASKIQYRNGAVRAKASQLELVESVSVTNESLLKTFTRLDEAGRTFSVSTGKPVELNVKRPEPKPVGDSSDFKIGQVVTVKKTGQEVKVLGYRDNMVQTVSTNPDDLAIKGWADYSHKSLGGNLFNARGHETYLPRELEAK